MVAVVQGVVRTRFGRPSSLWLGFNQLCVDLTLHLLLDRLAKATLVVMVVAALVVVRDLDVCRISGGVSVAFGTCDGPSVDRR